MSIDNLPTGGFHFRLNKGRGNFAYKLYKNTKRGELHNLADNRESIVSALKPYTRTLKRYGGLNRLQRRKVFKTIEKEEGGLNWGDRRDIKKVVKYLDRNKVGESVKENPFAAEPLDEKSQPRAGSAASGSNGAPTPVRVRINKDVSNVPSRVNPYIRRVSRFGEARQLGIVSANSSSSGSVIRRQEGGFVIPPPPGATPPKPITREAPSPESGRLRRVT